MRARRAKIVCTIGPASESDERLEGLIRAGMDVARLNFSHGKAEEHAARAARIRSEAARQGRTVAILQDLSGPKIRTGTGGPKTVEGGQRIRLIEGKVGSDDELAIGYSGLCRDLQPGDAILLSDGHIELRAESIDGDALVATVEHGGPLRDRMGVNLPAERLQLDALTEKDRRDFAAGVEIGVDYVALSFVRAPEDVRALKALCQEHSVRIPVIAKIETPQAVDRIDAICDEADAVMVARGDLGVELLPEQVPVVQRHIIDACRLRLKPVIVATEMLKSMEQAPRPTRAEASDVATAVLDGVDAVMLSGETAVGKHPDLACDMMARIIVEAESSSFFRPPVSESGASVPEAIARGACEIAREAGAKALVTLTQSGLTARLVSKARPPIPIVAYSPDAKTLARCALFWGVRAEGKEVIRDSDALAQRVGERLVEAELISKGDRFVMVYGAPVGHRGSTNAIRVEIA